MNQIHSARRQAASLLGCVLSFAAVVCGASIGIAQEKAQKKCRLPVLDDDEAWRRLPRLEDVAARRLPIWARALAGPLPQTTAAMLELDYLYRTSDAIDPRLHAKLRWVAAEANRCAYSQQYAESDLMTAGMTRAEVDQWKSGLDSLKGKEQQSVRFAHDLTLEADTITDEEVAALVAAYGEEQVVAMVLQIAYANFQDRLLLALNVDVEPDGPLRPPATRFAAPAVGLSIAAERTKPKEEKLASLPIDLGSEWPAFTFEQSVRGMEQQRARPGRVTVPEWKDVYPRLPPGLYSLDRPVRIKWSLVVMGYQPKLGPAWLKCLRMFGREANQDRVFEETLFWVITRANRCFY